MILVGLTGGIGSGKSTVAGILRDLGAEVIDADEVGHSVYRPGTAGWEAVVAAFGPEVVAADGTIDRRRLGAQVFGDAAARARLNAIVHPLIGEEIRRRISQAVTLAPARPVILEAALLLEAGWHHAVGEVWLVTARRETVTARLVVNRGLSEEEVEARRAAQMPEEQRRQQVQVVIENDGDVASLRQRVLTLWQERGWPRASVVPETGDARGTGDEA